MGSMINPGGGGQSEGGGIAVAGSISSGGYQILTNLWPNTWRAWGFSLEDPNIVRSLRYVLGVELEERMHER